MKILMIGPLCFTITGIGTTSKPIGTSQSSRIGRTPLPHNCMLIGPTCNGSMILYSKKVIAKAQTLGIYDILGLHQEWNIELVAQFYATTWRSRDGFDSTLNFSIEGHHYELTFTELPIIFGLAPNDFHIERISFERSISDNELATLYFPRNQNNYGTNHGMLLKYYIFNNIFWNILTPK
jgi:hypothetical protein